MPRGLNTAEVTARIRARLERENVAEVISNATVEADGHFITTVVWRQNPITLPIRGEEKCYTEIRWMTAIDGGDSINSGIVSVEWED